MATPATPHTMTTGMDEARAALASALSGGTPAAPEAPAPPPAPAPAPSEPSPAPAPPVQAAPVAPVPAAPAGTPAPTPGAAPEITDAAARRFLEMSGGDLNRALAKALEYNNRLGDLYRQSPELFQPGAVADPHRAAPVTPTLFEPPPPAPPEPPQVEVDPAAIQATVTQAVHQDPVATSLIREWYGNQQVLQGFDTKKLEIQQRISYNELKLKDPDYASPDDLRRPQIENDLSRLQNELGLVEARENRLLMQQERLSQRFDQRSAVIHQAISTNMQQRAEEEAYTAFEQQLEAAELRKTQIEWPSALDRCIKENNIPPEQVEDFKRDAAVQFHAAMGADPNLVIQDMYAFLSPVAKNLVARLDRYHRVRSGQYATGAALRAATPSPATGPGTAAPPAPGHNPTPEEAMAEATRYWRQRTRG